MTPCSCSTTCSIWITTEICRDFPMLRRMSWRPSCARRPNSAKRCLRRSIASATRKAANALATGALRLRLDSRTPTSRLLKAAGSGFQSRPNLAGRVCQIRATLTEIVNEFFCSANMAFAMYPGLTQGAIAALLVHASAELKTKYLPKMVEGVWTGTMNLTEPHCGTDLGLLRSKAVKQPDGSYKI